MQVALFPAVSTAVYEREVIPCVKLPGFVPSPWNVTPMSSDVSELSFAVGSVQDTVEKFWPSSMGRNWEDGQRSIAGSSLSGMRAI